jgi:hypothetical protein
MTDKPDRVTESVVERTAWIIQNWRDGNAGEDDALDTARWILREALTTRSQPGEDLVELRKERDALLQKPIDLAKMDSIDDDATDKMIAYYWWQQAQDARAALNAAALPVDKDALRSAIHSQIMKCTDADTNDANNAAQHIIDNVLTPSEDK